MKVLWGAWASLLGLPILTAFAAQIDKLRDPISVQVRGFNHTDRELVFSVDGENEFRLSPHSEGGNFCCVEFGNPWSEGMRTAVEWQWRGDGERHRQAIPTPEYKSLSGMSVHFLRSGEVKLIVSPVYFRSPQYPLKGEEASLYPPGQSPEEIWEAARTGSMEERISAHMMQMRRNGGIGILIDDSTLSNFVRQQLDVAISHGMSDLDDQQDFLVIAVLTSGKFVDHPATRQVLQRASDPGAFSAWASDVPREIFDGTHPLGNEPEPGSESPSTRQPGVNTDQDRVQ